jgi:hypothetical protein
MTQLQHLCSLSSLYFSISAFIAGECFRLILTASVILVSNPHTVVHFRTQTEKTQVHLAIA